MNLDKGTVMKNKGIIYCIITLLFSLMLFGCSGARMPRIATGTYYLSADNYIIIHNQHELTIISSDYYSLVKRLYLEDDEETIAFLVSDIKKRLQFSLEDDGNRYVLYVVVNYGGGIIITYNDEDNSLILDGDRYKLGEG